MADPVIIDTADLAPEPAAEPVYVRIGGNVYLAHPPKDTVLMGMDTDKDTITAAVSLDMLCDIIRGMLESDAAEEVMEMIRDPSNAEVTFATMTRIIDFLIADEDGPQWGKAINETMSELGSGRTPTTVKMPPNAAKKPAARKTPAKKTAAKRR